MSRGKFCLYFVCLHFFGSLNSFVYGQNSNMSTSSDMQFENFQVVDSHGLQTFFYNSQSQLYSPLYQRILNEIENEYQRIGLDQANQVLKQQDGFYIGGLNHIGLRWSRDFVDFNFEVHRQLAPDLFHPDRWIVTDELVIRIDASLLLDRLKNLDFINITETQYAAFAGVEFERRYRHAHFANSYSEGLVLNLNKLFLTFKQFRGRNYLQMGDYEFLSRSDALSFKAGAVGSVPLVDTGVLGLSASAGGMVQYKKVSSVDIHSIGPSDQYKPGERLRVSAYKEKSVDIGVSASVQADFLKLLRLTLLSYDFSYNLSESYRASFRFFKDDLVLFEYDSAEAKALERVLSLKGDHTSVGSSLDQFRISEELRKTLEKKTRYLVLLKGGIRNQKTEYIEVATNEHVTTFFRHNFERTDYQQNFISRVMGALIRSIFQIPEKVSDIERDTKKVQIEYRSEQNLIAQREDLPLYNEDMQREDNLSMVFSLNYFAQNRGQDRGLRSKHKKRAIDILAKLTGADPQVERMVRSDELIGPIRIDSRFHFGRLAIDHFNNLSSSRVYNVIDQICGYKPRGIFSFFRNLFNFCRHRLKSSYEKYEFELRHRAVTADDYRRCQRSFFNRRNMNMMQNCLSREAQRPASEIGKSIPLWRWADFAQTLHVENEDKVYFYFLFGLESTYHYGHVQGVRDNYPFQSFFNEGRFQGLGVVQDFQREQGLRSPASISYE